MNRVSRRWLLRAGLLLLAGFAAFVARPLFRLGTVAWHDRDTRTPPADGGWDDASRMNETPLAEIVAVSDEATARAALARARERGLGVAIAGARQSMGGQALLRDGMALDTAALSEMSHDDDQGILRVGAGARWAEVLAFLDRRGRSPALMQPYNDFSVGGSLAANCHGPMAGRPPIAASVVGLSVMLADGKVVRCDRQTEGELFSLVLGGYGLLGLILEADLRTVPNRLLDPTSELLSPADLAEALADEAGDDGVELRLARISVAPDSFLTEGLLTSYRAVDGKPPPLGAETWPSLRRWVFRAGTGDDYGRYLRWQLEGRVAPLLSLGGISRNQVLNVSATVVEDRHGPTTDILHGYFVPADQLALFLQRTELIVRDVGVALLDLELHAVAADDDSYLRYADRSLLALTMRFRQRRLPGEEYRMREATRGLIDAARDLGGRYQLPYRLHASRRQFNMAYPQGRRFFKRKRHYDPDGLFRNTFLHAYSADWSDRQTRREGGRRG